MTDFNGQIFDFSDSPQVWKEYFMDVVEPLQVL